VATLSTSSHSLKSANQLLFSSVFVIDSHKSVSWPSSWASSADMVEFEAVVCTCEAVIGVIFPGKFACGNEFKDSGLLRASETRCSRPSSGYERSPCHRRGKCESGQYSGLRSEHQRTIRWVAGAGVDSYVGAWGGLQLVCAWEF
jgi:hypothetical protein